MRLRDPKFLQKPSHAAVAGVVLLAFVGYVDWLTGPELAFAQFYLLPVSLFAWYIGRRSGYAMAVASAVMWMYVDALSTPQQHEAFYWLWNALVRGLFFVMAVEVVAQWKNTGNRLAQMVDDAHCAS